MERLSSRHHEYRYCWRQVVKEKSQSLVDSRFLDGMIIIQDEQPFLHMLRDIIEKERESCFSKAEFRMQAELESKKTLPKRLFLRYTQVVSTLPTS